MTKNQDILNHPDYSNEVVHLEETINEMRKTIDELENESRERRSKQRILAREKDSESARDLNNYNLIQKDSTKKIHNILSALESPYFGRVDFKDDNSIEFQSYYIGKVGFNQGSKYGVIDWRMPVASVFYECENGRAKYKMPDGTHTVDVKLKRQYTIKDARLISFIDDVITANIARALKKTVPGKKVKIEDDIISEPALLEKLKQHSDNKLKDIIETIRAEQNRIIRQPMNRVLVVQGVAGSGKSTVGLHRISYLLYNSPEMAPGKVLVVAPNKVFLDYIFDLLPGLDAKGVKQLTFEQLAFNVIGTSLKILKDEKLEFISNAEQKPLPMFLKDVVYNISRFKGSLSFARLIDYYINKKADDIARKLRDISLFDDQLQIGRDEQAKYLKSNAPLNNRIVTLRKAIEAKVNAFVEKQIYFSLNKAAENKLKKKAALFINSYFRDIRQVEPVSLYKELFEDSSIYKALHKHRYFSFVGQYTSKLLESGYIERDDLAALCYIKYMIDGINPCQKYAHIFVDEAQDLSLLEFVVLKLVSENNSMTIMGDINQSINSHRGITNWEQLINNIYSELNPQYFEVLNSYRSTKELVEFSNKLIPVNLPKAKPVARNGEKPSIEKVTSYKDGTEKIVKKIRYYQEKGCRSIGILAKHEKECRVIYSELMKSVNKFENINLIDHSTDKYDGGISIAPIALSKGLEFDAVILWNASAENYSNTKFDLKTLYVAVTRPMHYLHILYKGNITAHLKEFVQKNNA